uniref:cell wall elongation regulator TseB-like domain-containing protein n=1 Tax=Enterococcus faecalis TaxID=1351 RepID=UPI002477D708
TSANLETVDKFYWFTRKNTYFTLTGKNDKGTDIVVIVPKSGEKVTVLNQKDGQTEQQITDVVAKAHPDESVMKATLGLYDKRPAWEVVTENDQGVLTYYLMSFDKGEEINVVKDI